MRNIFHEGALFDGTHKYKKSFLRGLDIFWIIVRNKGIKVVFCSQGEALNSLNFLNVDKK